jgi:hypothetical protein
MHARGRAFDRQLRRIRGFHAVNVLRGYPLIEIRSPLEVIDDEEA